MQQEGFHVIFLCDFQTLRSIKCPSEDLSLTNCVLVHEGEFSSK